MVEPATAPTAEATLGDHPTIKEIYAYYAPMVKNQVMADVAYRNACVNSDRETADLEGKEAIKRAVLAYLNRKMDDSRYSTTYPPLGNVPPRYAIVRRNEWMVRESDVVISGVTHGWGGAAKTLDYARRRQKVIFQFPTHRE